MPCTFHNTLCQTCQQVCHEKCGLEFEQTAGSEVFARCACMNGTAQCVVCPGRCEASSHFHGMYKIQKVQKTVEKIMADIKAKFDAAVDDLDTARSEIDTFKGAMDLLKKAQLSKMGEIKELCRGVKRIVTSFNFVDELRSVLDSLEMEKAQMNSNKARDEAEATIRDLRSFIDDLCKDLPAAGSRTLERTDSGGTSRVYSRSPLPASSAYSRAHIDRESAEASRKQALEELQQRRAHLAAAQRPNLAGGYSQGHSVSLAGGYSQGNSASPASSVQASPGQAHGGAANQAPGCLLTADQMGEILNRLEEMGFARKSIEAVAKQLSSNQKRAVSVAEVAEALLNGSVPFEPI